MKRLLAAPRRVFAVGALAAVAVVVAASYGYAAVTADNQTYTGCLENGDLTNIAIGSTPLRACSKNATKISWSQTGPACRARRHERAQGADWRLTATTEAAGANCAGGGSKFTAAYGVTYVCNGVKGDKGEPGGSSLAALDGSPCTTATGEASTVVVTVTHSGTVDISCIARVTVSASFSGGTMERITIQDGTLAELSRSCRNAAECSATLPLGHYVGVNFHVENRNFEYTCPGESPKPAGNIPGQTPSTSANAARLSGNWKATTSSPAASSTAKPG